MVTTLIAIGSFILLLALLVFVRVKTGDRYKIGNTEIVVALIPVALALFLSGEVRELTIGDIRIAMAVQEAAESSISPDVINLHIEEVSTGERESLAELPDFIENRIEALSFRMSQPTRLGSELIVRYLGEMTQYPFFNFIIINHPDGSFFGMADAKDIAAMSRISSNPYQFENIANWLLSADKSMLETLPGFISADKALQEDVDTITALEQMSSMNLNILPVINDSGVFAGIVRQEQLASNMLLKMYKELQGKED